MRLECHGTLERAAIKVEPSFHDYQPAHRQIIAEATSEAVYIAAVVKLTDHGLPLHLGSQAIS